MNVRIDRVIEENGAYFKIYAEDQFVTCTSFRPEAPTDSIWSEKTNYERALKMVAVIEALPPGSNVYLALSTVETVYRTENNKQATL